MTPETDTDVVAHNQSATSNNLSIGTLVNREQGGLPASSLHNELARLCEADTRRVNILSVLPMAAAWSKDTNNQLAILGNRNTKLSEDLTNAREEIATLKAANTERAKHVPLVFIGLLFGPIIVKFGFDQMILMNWGTGIVAIIIGGCMIVGAFLGQRGDKK